MDYPYVVIYSSTAEEQIVQDTLNKLEMFKTDSSYLKEGKAFLDHLKRGSFSKLVLRVMEGDCWTLHTESILNKSERILTVEEFSKLAIDDLLLNI